MATITETVSDAVHSSSAVQKLRDQADAAVQRIQPQIAAVSTYARNEPTKALLVSAAAGAALMGLIALMVRSGGRSSPSSLASSTIASIRDAALDLADSAQSMVADALDQTKKRAVSTGDDARLRAAAARDDAKSRAKSALETTQQRAAAAAESVSESVAEAWQKVRDQAAPMVDRVRPQVEAAAHYVKDDPTRAALGLAAAGAIIAGLVALARQASGETGDDSLPY